MSTTSIPSHVITLDKATLSKSVQQMAIDGDEPPPSYIIKDHVLGALETSPPSAPIPIIDMSCFLSPMSLDQEEIELAKLRSALTDWGCCQVVNNGVSSLFLDNLRKVIGDFFQLPYEEKLKSARKLGSYQGYGNDMVVSENQVLDWCDRFSVDIFPENQTHSNIWPLNPSSFRETIEEYGSKIRHVSAVLFKVISKSLSLNDQDCFSRVFTEDEEAVMIGKFILYPPSRNPDVVYGLKPHVDGTCMTVLLQDAEVEGLQVFNSDKWFTVPLIRNALFVNLGDQMKIMSNGIFKSPMHRVVTNVEKGKITVATFINPGLDKEIGPVEALIDEARPRMYKNVKNYGPLNYECIQKGIIAIDTLKL